MTRLYNHLVFSIGFSAFLLSSLSGFSQQDSDLPPNAKPGKCYARCYIPTEYKFVETTDIDAPAQKKMEVVPAIYKTVLDTTILKPAEKKLEVVPAKYETVTERVMVEPARNEWVRKKADPGCLSENPEDCQVMCLVEVPATYKSMKRRVLKNPAYTKEINIPAKIKVVEKKVLVKPASTREINIPATYKTVLKRVVAKQGGYQDWREVMCGENLTVGKIQEIQMALKAKGYDPGPADNIMGEQTKAALTKYQKDHSLPIGNLDLETLRSLGVSPETKVK